MSHLLACAEAEDDLVARITATCGNLHLIVYWTVHHYYS